MAWMNAYEVDEAYDVLRDHKVLGGAVAVLRKLKDAVNGCSDGWHCWKKPTDAAAKLMELVGPCIRARGPRDDVTAEQLTAAIKPIRKFVKWCHSPESKMHPSYPLEMTEEDIDIFLGLKAERPVSDAIRKLAIEAEGVQNASNLRGISIRFAAVLSELRQALKDDDCVASNDVIENHPITRVWVDKLSHLAGIQNLGDPIIMEAHKQVSIMASVPAQKAVVS